MNEDSYDDMLEQVQAFHNKHDFKNTGGEEMEKIMQRESKMVNGRIRVSEFRD